MMADPVVYPVVGATLYYYGSPASEPMPATLAQDLGGGHFNLRVVRIDGMADPQTNVLYVGLTDAIPASGAFCKMPGARNASGITSLRQPL
jgi:hypothetical protein